MHSAKVIGGLRLTPNPPYATGHRPNKGAREKSLRQIVVEAEPYRTKRTARSRTSCYRGGKIESHTIAVVLDSKDGAGQS